MSNLAVSESIVRRQPSGADWRLAHARLVAHKEKRSALDYQEGELLLETRGISDDPGELVRAYGS